MAMPPPALDAMSGTLQFLLRKEPDYQGDISIIVEIALGQMQSLASAKAELEKNGIRIKEQVESASIPSNELLAEGTLATIQQIAKLSFVTRVREPLVEQFAEIPPYNVTSKQEGIKRLESMGYAGVRLLDDEEVSSRIEGDNLSNYWYSVQAPVRMLPKEGT